MTWFSFVSPLRYNNQDRSRKTVLVELERAMREDLSKEGYNKEEEYFNKLNQELIEKLKKKDEAEKLDETEKAEVPEKEQS